MPTTTIRLPEDLKAKVAAAAERSGVTPHNFMLQAIAEKAEAEERRSDFHQAAEERYAQIAESGQTIRWQEMRSYLESRVVGKKARRPLVRKLAR